MHGMLPVTHKKENLMLSGRPLTTEGGKMITTASEKYLIFSSSERLPIFFCISRFSQFFFLRRALDFISFYFLVLEKGFQNFLVPREGPPNGFPPSLTSEIINGGPLGIVYVVLIPYLIFLISTQITNAVFLE